MSSLFSSTICIEGEQLLVLRQPSPAQMQIHQHLGALITVSDLPGDCPLPPGWSGPEFIARLIELSNFVNSHPVFDLTGYGGEFHPKTGHHPQEAPLHPQV